MKSNFEKPSYSGGLVWHCTLGFDSSLSATLCALKLGRFINRKYRLDLRLGIHEFRREYHRPGGSRIISGFRDNTGMDSPRPGGGHVHEGDPLELDDRREEALPRIIVENLRRRGSPFPDHYAGALPPLMSDACTDDEGAW